MASHLCLCQHVHQFGDTKLNNGACCGAVVGAGESGERTTDVRRSETWRMSNVLVFVGGFGAPGNEWPLTPIRRSAREHGWRTKYFNERLVFGPIATSVERLVNLIHGLHRVHDTIVVVGHSMGGLVAEHAAALGAPIDALVTIGTPHRGHSLSRFGPLAVMREMGTNSSYLRSVEAIPGRRPPILVIIGARDRLVSKSATRPKRSHTFLEIPAVGHLGVIFDQRTADAILQWAEVHTRERAG